MTAPEPVEGTPIVVDFADGTRIAGTLGPLSGPVESPPEKCCEDHNRLEEPGEMPLVCSPRIFCCDACPTPDCVKCDAAPREFVDGLPLWHAAGHPHMDRTGVHPDPRIWRSGTANPGPVGPVESREQPSHECDSGDFDRTICPEPCGTMHSYCSTCGKCQDACDLISAYEAYADDRAEGIDLNPWLATIDRLTAERDRARDLAAHLEADAAQRLTRIYGVRKVKPQRSSSVHGMSEADVREFMEHHADTHEALTRLDYRNDDWTHLEAELAKTEEPSLGVDVASSTRADDAH